MNDEPGSMLLTYYFHPQPFPNTSPSPHLAWAPEPQGDPRSVVNLACPAQSSPEWAEHGCVPQDQATGVWWPLGHHQVLGGGRDGASLGWGCIPEPTPAGARPTGTCEHIVIFIHIVQLQTLVQLVEFIGVQHLTLPVCVACRRAGTQGLDPGAQGDPAHGPHALDDAHGPSHTMADARQGLSSLSTDGSGPPDAIGRKASTTGTAALMLSQLS